MDIFVVGTLSYPPLLAQVTGDAGIAQRARRAVRPGFRLSRAAQAPVAVMHPDPGSEAEGLIVSGLDDTAMARLDYFEAAFGYARTTVTVRGEDGTLHEVVAHVPPDGQWTPAGPWDHAGWITERGAITVLAAREAMEEMAATSPKDMGARWGPMLDRAASRLRAAQQDASGDFGRDDVEVMDVRRPFTGFFNVEEVDLRFRRYDGAMSDPVGRTVFVGVDCAIVLPYDPVRDRVLLVQQFRPGAFLRGDPAPWTVEPVAGRIDIGEDAAGCARREAREEAGVDITDLHLVADAYPSPGTTTEFFSVFVGIADLPDGIAGVGGAESEAEDIRSHTLDWATFDRNLGDNVYRLLPLVAAGHWLARHRDRLRAAQRSGC